MRGATRGEIEVVAYSLDADEDKRPEQVRYYDAETNALLRIELDRDYDGRIDAWQDYEGGALARRTLDESGDGKPDAWEQYRDRRMTSREVDRNHDGTRDAFYAYQIDSLVEERHDGNDDGKIDLVVKYENRVRVALEEDRDRDARMDQWTHYELRGDKEIPALIERDTNGDGRADVFEKYDTKQRRAGAHAPRRGQERRRPDRHHVDLQERQAREARDQRPVAGAAVGGSCGTGVCCRASEARLAFRPRVASANSPRPNRAAVPGSGTGCRGGSTGNGSDP